tara:strand:+ start:1700 stop:2077 length:378 start_codon:yes stop_codon:yes gene_type:complete
MDESPLLTMVKSRLVNAQPELSSQSEVLLNTLSGLCSFHTSGDLASFLFSKNFSSLIGTGNTWVIFEIGVYRDDTKTIEITPTNDGVTIVDASGGGKIPNNSIMVNTESDCARILLNWYNSAMSE